ncbi:MAG: trypsin-like peptidase domain-containing protein [Dissulfurispiraceae bacterium]|jgi:serine protease Do
MKRSLFFCLLLLLVLPNIVSGFPAVEVYEKNSKAVVLILASNDNSGHGMVGSGSIIAPGTVITNAHVIYDKSTSSPWSNIRVYLKPDIVTGKFSTDLVKRHKADVIAYDTELDLAVLKVEGLSSDRGIIEMGNSEEIKIGEEVVAIGHPEQGGLWTLTYGRISGEIKNQTNIPGKNVFQTDTSLNRGNSGGPLLDRRGYMIGVNSTAARLGEDNMPITGINFAIRSSVVKKWLDGQRIFIAYGKKALYSETSPEIAATEDITHRTANKEPKPDKVKTANMEPQPVQKKADLEPKVQPKTEPMKETIEAKKTSMVEVKPEAKPAEKAEVVEKQTKEPADDNKINKTEIPKKMISDTILTPKRPYRIEDLWAEVEKEMGDMMEEMRQRINR